MIKTISRAIDDEYRKAYIIYNGSRSKMASALGVGERTVYNYLRANPQIAKDLSELVRIQKLADNSHFNLSPKDRDEWCNKDSYSGK